MNTSGNLCPICKNEIEKDAQVCRHCGAWLEDNPTKLVKRIEHPDAHANASAFEAESYINVNLIPEEGIGIHVAGERKPLYVPIAKEIILGRMMETTTTSEAFLDLAEMHAVTMGVSKRHAMIRRTGSGYEVIDLTSRNGSWLNAERLVPNKPYPLPSGSQLRIGNMRLLIMHRLAPK